MKLSPKECAQRAGVSVALVYQLCDERRLTHYRVGGRGRRGKILIDPEDLEAFLESCKVTDGAAPVREQRRPVAAEFSFLPPSSD
jgi:excisionase family DNA binding protein